MNKTLLPCPFCGGKARWVYLRCKECEDYNTIGCSKGFGWCESMDRGISDDFYCANGAKMEVK